MGIGLFGGIVAFSCGGVSSSQVEAAENVAAPPLSELREEIRATGIVKASRYVTVQTPQMAGPSGRLTLVGLAPNGAVVEEGDVLAQFDSTEQLDAERQAQAKLEDLSHQVEQSEPRTRLQPPNAVWRCARRRRN